MGCVSETDGKSVCFKHRRRQGEEAGEAGRAVAHLEAVRGAWAPGSQQVTLEL